jgi:hypothetical protein
MNHTISRHLHSSSSVKSHHPITTVCLAPSPVPHPPSIHTAPPTALTIANNLSALTTSALPPPALTLTGIYISPAEHTTSSPTHLKTSPLTR